jgi:hypothetical protein
MRRHARALAAIKLVTALAALMVAIAVTADLPRMERSFAVVSAPVQSVVSVGVPFLGVLMTYDLHLRRSQRSLSSTLLTALGIAVGFAVFGAVVSAVAVAAYPSRSAYVSWGSAIGAMLGGILVQVVAQLIGTGFGLLVRRAILACLATIVCPLGLWLVLGAIAPQARAWLTPYESARHILAGTMTPTSWLAFVVMACMWGIGLNLAGIRRFRVDQPTDKPPATLEYS